MAPRPQAAGWVTLWRPAWRLPRQPASGLRVARSAYSRPQPRSSLAAWSTAGCATVLLLRWSAHRAPRSAQRAVPACLQQPVVGGAVRPVRVEDRPPEFFVLG